MEVGDVRVLSPDQVAHGAVTVTGPQSASGETGPPEPSRVGDLVVPAHVLNDLVARARQQFRLGGEDRVLATRVLIPVMD